MKTIIIDHDIGTNPDDFFTLLFLLHDPSVHVPLLISGNCFPRERALFAQKMLAHEQAHETVSLAGEETGCVDFFANHYIEDETLRDSSHYTEHLKRILDTHDDVTYLCIQGLSNLAYFLKKHPDYQNTLDIIHMGMSLTDAEKGYIAGGTNMEADPLAAKYIYESNLSRMKVVGAHTTINDAIRVTPETEIYTKLKESTHPNHVMLLQHLNEYFERKNKWPALHDPLTGAIALGHPYVDFDTVHVDFRDDGQYTLGTQIPVTISKKEIEVEGFMGYCVSHL